MSPLQQAAKQLIDRWESPLWKDQPHTAEFIAELRKALDAEIAQSVEPYAVFQGLVDSGEHGAFNLDLLKMIPRGAYLYLHPPQPQATTPAVPILKEALAQQGIKLRTEFEPKQRDSELATEPSGERAELIERQRWVQENGANPAMRALAKSTADMLEADAQQANKPTGWDNGLSQDYCAEFGQWLASRPGARQQVKEMFEADAQQAKQVPLSDDQIIATFCTMPDFRQYVSAFKAGVKLAEKHHGIGGEA